MLLFLPTLSFKLPFFLILVCAGSNGEVEKTQSVLPPGPVFRVRLHCQQISSTRVQAFLRFLKLCKHQQESAKVTAGVSPVVSAFHH